MSEYDFISKIYDPALFVFLNPIRKAVLKTIKQINPEKIIDFCCGTGNQLKYLKKAGINNIQGIDIDEGMISQSYKGKYGVNCSIKDATNTGFRDNSFDFVMISLAIHETEEPVRKNIIKEIFRILKPGGHLLVVDYLLDKNTYKFAKLGVHIIERMAGKHHYSCFKNFVDNNGLDYYIQKEIILEKKFWFNSIVMRLYKN